MYITLEVLKSFFFIYMTCVYENMVISSLLVCYSYPLIGYWTILKV